MGKLKAKKADLDLMTKLSLVKESIKLNASRLGKNSTLSFTTENNIRVVFKIYN